MSATQSTTRVQSTTRAQSRTRIVGVRSARLAAVLLTGACAALIATHAASPPDATQAASPAAAARHSAAVTWSVAETTPWSTPWAFAGSTPSTAPWASPWSPIVVSPGDDGAVGSVAAVGAVGSVVEAIGDFVGDLAPGADALGAGAPTVTVQVFYPAGWQAPVTGRR